MNPEGPPVYSAPPEVPYRKKNNTLLWVALVFVGLCACSVPILAAILFPVFSQAKVAAQRTACVTNVRRLATGHLIYASDNDDRFPQADVWMDRVTPYVRETEQDAFQCPIVRDGHGYAMADALSGKPSEVESPATTVLVFETPDLGRNAHGDPKSVTPPVRHGSQSIGYADGSARSLRPGR